MKESIRLGGISAAPGEKTQGILLVPGTTLSMPMVLINGRQEGKLFLLTAGVHSSEYPGIVAAIRLGVILDPDEICGAVAILPAVNYEGFMKRVTYVMPSDGKNLNSQFPGDLNGSDSQKLAAFLTETFHGASGFHIDLHAGDRDTELIPHIYCPTVCEEAVAEMSLEMARACHVPYIVRSRFSASEFSSAAKGGCPGILLERGGRGLWTEEEVKANMDDITAVMRLCGALPGGAPTDACEGRIVDEYYALNTPLTGFWYPNFHAGDLVHAGDCLGEIRDCFDRVLYRSEAPFYGVLLYQVCTLITILEETLLVVGRLDDTHLER